MLQALSELRAEQWLIIAIMLGGIYAIFLDRRPNMPDEEAQRHSDEVERPGLW